MNNASNVNQDPSFNSNLASNNNNKDNLIINHQIIKGISNKVDELPNLWTMRLPHILCYSQHHQKDTEIDCISINSYKLGSCYFRKPCKNGGVCILVHDSLQYTPINLNKFCMDQEIEVCAIKLHQYPSNICILSTYRSPSGNFTHFLNFLESILNHLYNNSVNLVTCGDININYNDNNSNKIQLNSLLATYNLQSIVDFPPRIRSNSSTTTDNIFIDKSKNTKFTIHPYSNGLSDHDAQILILHNITTHNLPACSYTRRLINT
jgi:exonuclease III